ncbi:hypothetical protein [Flavobacterium sp. 3HN19-14]|uniref:hypothetical protein n=1 Tax=Flavobacterium sp. 3HN19-14 TaxID=3448133 RepID=UPI003EDF3A11
MAWNNNNRGQGSYPRKQNDYAYSGNFNAPFAQNRQGYQSMAQNQQAPKKSGANYTKIKKGGAEGFYAISAWRKTRYGLMTAKAFPCQEKGGGVVTHKGKEKGHEHIRYAVDVVMNGQSQTYFCLFRVDTQKILINELGLCISPNGSGYTSSGKCARGFFGSPFKK